MSKELVLGRNDLWDPEVARQVRAVIEPFVPDEKAKVNRDQWLQRIQKAFLDLGGQERFTFEMHRNYAFFAKNFLLRLVPNSHEVAVKGSLSVTIRPAIPPSVLDGEFYALPPTEDQPTPDRPPHTPQE
jgi:hypothetical protein